MIFKERHTDDDVLLLISALYSIDIKRLSVLLYRKENSRDLIG